MPKLTDDQLRAAYNRSTPDGHIGGLRNVAEAASAEQPQSQRLSDSDKLFALTVCASWSVLILLMM